MAAFLLNVSLMTTIPATPTPPTQAELTGGPDLLGSETTEELVEIPAPPAKKSGGSD